MKTKRIIVLAIVIAVVALSLFIGKQISTKNTGAEIEANENKAVEMFDDENKAVEMTADEINNSSNLPMNLLTPYEDVREALRQRNDLDYIANFMSFDYYADTYMISFSGFPHDDSDLYLLDISFSDIQFNVYGMDISQTFEEAIQILEKNGYEAKENNLRSFVKNDVTITLNGASVIEEIEINVPSKYVSGRIY